MSSQAVSAIPRERRAFFERPSAGERKTKVKDEASGGCAV